MSRQKSSSAILPCLRSPAWLVVRGVERVSCASYAINVTVTNAISGIIVVGALLQIGQGRLGQLPELYRGVSRQH